jgi:hypothetical protein
MLRRALPLCFVLACDMSTQPEAPDTAQWPMGQVPPPPYVIDSNNAYNDTARYYVEVSGNWTSSTNVGGYYNSGYWVSAAAWTYDPANFWFYLDANACLKVEAWWTSFSDRAPNAPVQSYNGGGSLLNVTYVNQRNNGGRWNEIGRFIFTPGWNRVLLSRWADLGTYVVADAIRVTPVSDCAGWCGPDADGDGVAQCQDACDNDPAKTSPGTCGCGVADTNSDGDAWANCQETCDNDPAKRDPGVCGCGVADANSDGDSALDCQETCDNDPNKTDAGVCGCGEPDVDGDGDGWLDCEDACVEDPAKFEPGACGCGVSDLDSDGDGAADCVDACPADAAKTDPGECGCGVIDEDLNGDGQADCTVCGDGVLTAPEACDDGGRVPNDGCDSFCQWEPLLFSIDPGLINVPNAFEASNAQPGEGVVFLMSTRLGSTPVPGCPNVVVPLNSPTVLDTDRADAFGVAGITRTPPMTVAGRTFAFVAVERDSCRVTDVWFQTF